MSPKWCCLPWLKKAKRKKNTPNQTNPKSSCRIMSAYILGNWSPSHYPPVNKHSNGKSPSWIGNTSSNWWIFHCYVRLPEGNSHNLDVVSPEKTFHHTTPSPFALSTWDRPLPCVQRWWPRRPTLSRCTSPGRLEQKWSSIHNPCYVYLMKHIYIYICCYRRMFLFFWRSISIFFDERTF